MIRIAVAVVEQNDHFLVGTRGEHQSLAGFAEFPGGKIEPGETPTTAAVRECWEETGVRVLAITECNLTPPQNPPALTETLVVHHQYDHGLLEIHFVACAPLPDSPPPCPPFRWVPRGTLAELQFPPANESLIAALQKV